tara:strand:+ start:59081 stop:59512 length:432 start_codon:yes stop_codon:yes gene_type:complete
MYKHIIFATDLSESSQSLSNKVKNLVNIFGARLSLIHVLEPIPTAMYANYQDFEIKILEHSQSELASLGKVLSVPLVDQYVEFGSVRLATIAKAEEINADLILVSNHEKKGLAKFLGSNANGILQSAKCDVFVIHASSLDNDK